MVNTEQGKIDSSRDPKEKAAAVAEQQAGEAAENSEQTEEDESPFPDFITNL
jgi:hypothetical protein